MDRLRQSLARFVGAEDGSQVVEYALIIALVSIVLTLALNSAVTGLSASLSELADRVTSCFTSTAGTC
ncbi:MAG TPA: Flp family type IVb pilin [Ramlibacter sp.]